MYVCMYIYIYIVLNKQTQTTEVFSNNSLRAYGAAVLHAEGGNAIGGKGSLNETRVLEAC